MRWLWAGLGSALVSVVGCGSSSSPTGAGGALGNAGMAGLVAPGGIGGASSAGDSASLGGMIGSNGGTGGSTGGATASPGGASSTEPSAAAVCDAYAVAECDFTLRCNPLYFYQSLGTMAACTALYSATCLDRLSAPGVKLKPADWQGCGQAIATTTCAIPRPAACRFQGTLADGSGCAYDGQCSGGLCKIADWFDICGVCSSPTAAGESCHQHGGCQAGLECSLVKGETCIVEVAQGGACEPTSSACSRYLSCQDNVCQPQPRLGEACDAYYGGCDPTDDSECLNGICQAIIWNVEGGACQPSIGVICAAGFDCDPADGPGICHASTPIPQQLAADCQ